MNFENAQLLFFGHFSPFADVTLALSDLTVVPRHKMLWES